MLSNFFVQLMNGIALGSTYALIALGYTMVYGIILLINFAHGEIFMSGAFVGLILVTVFHVHIIIAFLGAMLFCMIMGVIIEKIAYKPLRRSTRLAALISAIGVSIFLSNLANLIFGANPTSYPPTKEILFPVKSFELFAGAQVTNLQILIIATSAILMIILQYFIKNTRIGKAMRATSQDYDTAALMGINVNKIISYTFAIGSSLAAAGGVLVGIYFGVVKYNMGTLVGLKAFTAAVLGGIGSIPGAMFGGIALGIGEMFAVAIGLSSYRDAIAFGILIIVLLVKPTGLFGTEIQKKV
ncbi:branched-chain amino acid ABC transporter permease [Desulfotruncus alcoholivorax]|uniref:branched-chain amino acid ABC transporter permease n=1 Tax=Desulfotruncus alcoholivorax TaxID=265477 RepID=UPI0003FF9AAB|nr:branched-chain amino acid ABC transporter permease [Desulfotruncus alcoholivorax]